MADKDRRGEKPGTRGAKALTAEAIVEAAVRIGDQERIESLTVRRLASDLGVGTMTLYSYFRSKEEIIDGVADYILGRFVIPDVEGVGQDEAMRLIARALLDMMRLHPSVVYLLASRTTTSTMSMKAAMEDVIGCLRRAGFQDEEAVRIYALLMIYTLGFASYQMPRPWGLSGHDADELRRQRRHFYASLPSQEFPNLVEFNDAVTHMASDQQFEFGLTALIEGVRTMLGTSTG